MARARNIGVAVDRIDRSREKVARVEEMLDMARRESRRAMLDAYEMGMSQTELATRWGTSQSRMKENITKAKAERDGSVYKI